MPLFAADPVINDPHFSADPKGLYLAASQFRVSDGADISVVHDEESYVFDGSGSSVHTVYLVFRVLTQRGADRWGQVAVNWEPWHEERPVIRARVISSDFAVHGLDEKTLTDAPANQDDPTIFSDRRVLRAPLSAVAPEVVVEEEFVVKGNAPFSPAGSEQRVFFGRVGTPVQHSRLILEAPASLPLRYSAQLLPDLKTQRQDADGRTRIQFDYGAMEALDDAEINLPSDVPAYPMITFSTGASWNQIAKAYSDIIDRNVGDDLRLLVEELIKGKASRTEKAQALLEFLDQQIRYTGVEFREATVVPRSPAYTLNHKYGDCKDKAALLVALLRTAGVPAYVALLRVSGRMDVPEDLPGMGLFDHAIVYAPGDPDLWIDATDEYARLGSLPGADLGRLALIARPGSDRLVRTPESSSSDNVLLERREIHLAENGPASIVETSEPKGVFESEYRRSYADGQNKDIRENLAKYVESQYLAENLDRMDRSNPRDFSKPFELTLESDRAKRGLTELDIAVGAIRLEGLFSHLPEALRTRDASNDNPVKGTRSKPWRKGDYQLPEPFVADWEYQIVPPPGFQAKALPPDITQLLGPARLTQRFTQQSDGSVHASLRFDTVQRKFTVAEASEMRKKIAQVISGRPILVYFEPVGEALLREDKVREAVSSYRDLIAQHPKESVHHLQMANTLLRYGLGGPARDEARLATRLEPQSALAYRTLAHILEFDLVGRQWRPGSDYAGAVAAYREAEKLDPDDKTSVGNLAILLEYNQWGARYGMGANLQDAIAEYRKLTPEQLSSLGLQNNLPFALFYAGEFEEAEKSAESLNPQLRALIAACETALHGSQAGIAEANRGAESDAQFKEVAKSAGRFLQKKRRYIEAADLLEAGASGDDAASTMEQAATLRKTQPYESLAFGDNPAAVAMHLILVLNRLPINTDLLSELLSRNGRQFFLSKENLELHENINRVFFTGDALLGIPAEADFDESLAQAQPKVEGNDSSGYAVVLWAGSDHAVNEYVIKEDGKYKVLGGLMVDDGAAVEVLDRIAAHNPAAASALLDWVWDHRHSGDTHDPLGGDLFARFWTKGKEADANAMRLAAAALMAQFKSTASRGLGILEAARKATADEDLRTNIDLAICTAYDRLGDYQGILRLISVLAQRFPDSSKAFTWRGYALRCLGRFDEADTISQERLKRLPNDADALWERIRTAVERGDPLSAYERSQELVSAGKADAGDLNSMAWQTLFFARPGGPDVETALKSIQLRPNQASTLHTLGCIYAETGKLKQSWEVLIQAMNQLRLNDLNSDYWYAFGRIAEQAGEDDVAKDYYAKVTKPKNDWQVPDSTYTLARTRLKILSARVKQKAKPGPLLHAW